MKSTSLRFLIAYGAICFAAGVLGTAAFLSRPAKTRAPSVSQVVQTQTQVAPPASTLKAPNPVISTGAVRSGSPALIAVPSAEVKKLLALAETDIGAAFARIGAYSPVSGQSQLRISLAQHLLWLDFSKAPEVLGYLKGSFECQAALLNVVMPATYRDPKATLETIAHLVGEPKNHALSLAIQAQLNGGNIEGAVATLDSMPYSNIRQTAVSSVASAIGAKGFDYAIAWLNQLLPGHETRQATDAVKDYFISRKDYVAVDRFLEQSSEREDRARLISVLASQFAPEDTSGRQALAERLPAEERELVSEQAIFADRSSTLEAKLAKAASLSDSRRSSTIDGIVGQAVRTDPLKVAAVVISSPEVIREAAIPSLVANWATVDTASASDWVRDLPKGILRDKGISVLVLRIRWVDRPSASEAAGWIDDPKLKADLLQMLANGH